MTIGDDFLVIHHYSLSHSFVESRLKIYLFHKFNTFHSRLRSSLSTVSTDKDSVRLLCANWFVFLVLFRYFHVTVLYGNCINISSRIVHDSPGIQTPSHDHGYFTKPIESSEVVRIAPGLLLFRA